MDLGVDGRVVAVTGASKGIGFACAAAFAAEGARVVLVSRSGADRDAALAKLPKAKHAPHAFAFERADAVQALAGASNPVV